MICYRAQPPPSPARRLPRRFLAVTTVWIVGRFCKPADFAFPPSAPEWKMLWGRGAVHFRHWSAPVPTTQATDPYVQQVGPNAGGITSRGGSAPADLYAYSSGYYFARGTAYVFDGI